MAGSAAPREELIDSGSTVAAGPADARQSGPNPVLSHVATDRYVVIDEIGRGKMGIVLRAYGRAPEFICAAVITRLSGAPRLHERVLATSFRIGRSYPRLVAF